MHELVVLAHEEGDRARVHDELEQQHLLHDVALRADGAVVREPVVAPRARGAPGLRVAERAGRLDAAEARGRRLAREHLVDRRRRAVGPEPVDRERRRDAAEADGVVGARDAAVGRRRRRAAIVVVVATTAARRGGDGQRRRRHCRRCGGALVVALDAEAVARRRLARRVRHRVLRALVARHRADLVGVVVDRARRAARALLRERAGRAQLARDLGRRRDRAVDALGRAEHEPARL